MKTFLKESCLVPAGIALIALALAACGDDVTEVTNVYQSGLEVADSVKDLPKCTDDNVGAQAFVKDDNSTYVCIDREWISTASGAGNGDFACKTEELKDGSGLKIICNGDSIGVVLNGEKGKDGKDGNDGEDGKDAVLSNDTLENDSERVAISLDSLVGFTQKGPFVKGSTVYLYELSDGRTLKQTNGNFTSNIVRDDGRYKFTARDLVSQYAMVVVDGFYRNEVTGKPSSSAIRLKAITDMRKRNSVNVNILTHLEFERVYHLVTKGDSTGKKLTVKQAKRQAQKEILDIFHIELEKDADAEDMDVFGSSDADAALLAISILLQEDRTELEMMALLSEISTEITEMGKWEGDRADSIKTVMADWAFGKEMSKFRKNVEGWHLSEKPVGNFEKFIEKFIAETYGIKVCGGESTAKQEIKNSQSIFNGRKYECYRDSGMSYATWVDIRHDNPYLNKDVTYGHVIDWRDRRMYSTIDIGYMDSLDFGWTSYLVLAENLDFEYRVNGKRYGSACYKFDCELDSSRILGRYYTWGAAMDSAGIYSNDGLGCGFNKICSPQKRIRGICPEGWFLPTKKVWKNIVEFAKMKVREEQNVELDKDSVSFMFKTTSGWRDRREGPSGNGENTVGFSGFPSGWGVAANESENVNYDSRDYFLGEYLDIWSSTELSTINAVTFGITYYDNIIYFNTNAKIMGYPVRCVRSENAWVEMIMEEDVEEDEG